jgi:hypothetical protein
MFFGYFFFAFIPPKTSTQLQFRLWSMSKRQRLQTNLLRPSRRDPELLLQGTPCSLPAITKALVQGRKDWKVTESEQARRLRSFHRSMSHGFFRQMGRGHYSGGQAAYRQIGSWKEIQLSLGYPWLTWCSWHWKSRWTAMGRWQKRAVIQTCNPCSDRFSKLNPTLDISNRSDMVKTPLSPPVVIWRLCRLHPWPVYRKILVPIQVKWVRDSSPWTPQHRTIISSCPRRRTISSTATTRRAVAANSGQDDLRNLTVLTCFNCQIDFHVMSCEYLYKQCIYIYIEII